MAALNFPSNPAVNDIFTSGDRSWKYNGVAWQLQPRTTDNIAEGSNNLYFTNALLLVEYGADTDCKSFVSPFLTFSIYKCSFPFKICNNFFFFIF